MHGLSSNIGEQWVSVSVYTLTVMGNSPPYKIALPLLDTVTV